MASAPSVDTSVAPDPDTTEGTTPSVAAGLGGWFSQMTDAVKKATPAALKLPRSPAVARSGDQAAGSSGSGEGGGGGGADGDVGQAAGGPRAGSAGVAGDPPEGGVVEGSGKAFQKAAAKSAERAWGNMKNLWSATKALASQSKSQDSQQGSGNVSGADMEAGAGAAAGGAGVGAAAEGLQGSAGKGEEEGVDEDPGETAGLLGGVKVPGAVGSGLSSMRGFFSQRLDNIKNMTPKALGGNAEASEPEDTYCGLSRVQRLQAFLLLLFAGCTLIGMSIFVFLPMVLFAPSKFALSFTMGSVCFMGAFAAFRGPKVFLKSLLARDKLGFTSAYLLSIAFTIHAALFVGSYFLVILAGGCQITALMWYGAAHVPYGRMGMKIMSRFCATSFKRVCWPCVKGTAQLCTACGK